MRIVFTFCLCLFGSAAFSQTIEARYEVSFKSDSTNLSNISVEEAYLYIKPDKFTVYATEDFYKLDTLFRNASEGRGISRDGLGRPTNSYQTYFSQMIFHSLENQDLTFYQKIVTDYYKAIVHRKLDWKIDTSKVETVSGYECNQATTYYAGRKYNAWFTTEIPVSSGPYVFRGLPGLIVKVEDEQNHYSFILQSVKITDQEVQDSPLFIKKLIVTEYEKIFELRERLRKDPFEFMGIRMGSNVFVSPEMETRAKKRVAADNNPLELRVD